MVQRIGMRFRFLFLSGVSLYVGLAVLPSGLAINDLPVDPGSRWCAYSPTNYDPNAGVQPSLESIDADLDFLIGACFQGIMTYGADGNIALIPERAALKGLRVIMGVWNPNNQLEIDNAISASTHVDGYIVGTEGLFFGRYTRAQLESAIETVRNATGKPVTTSEIWFEYVGDVWLVNLGDWVAPNVHPFLPIKRQWKKQKGRATLKQFLD